MGAGRSIVAALLAGVMPAAILAACVGTEGLTGSQDDASTNDGSGGGDSTIIDSGGGGDDATPSDAGLDADAASPYVDEVKSDAPIAYYRLNDAPSTAVKDEMGAFNGTVVGSVGFSAPGPSATTKAMSFDSQGWVVADALARRGTAWPALTLEAWFNGSALTLEEIFVAFSTSTGGDSCRLFRDEPTDLFVYDDGTARASSTTIPQVDQWYHVVVTVDGGGLGHIYVDGKDQVSFATTAQPPMTDGFFVLGAENKGDGGIQHKFKGRLSEVAVYDKALTAARVAAHFTAMTGKTP